MKRKEIPKTLIFILLVIAGVSGCNIFEFLHSGTSSGTNAVDEYIAEGKRLLSTGDFEQAERQFQYAIWAGTTTDDKVTDAYYYHAVAYSRSRDVDSLTIMLGMIAAMKASSPTGLLGEMGDNVADIYDACKVSKDDLWMIFTSTSDPEFRSVEVRPENVYFDLTMSATLKAVSSIALAASNISGLLLKYQNGEIDWTDPDAWASCADKDEIKNAAKDGIDAAAIVMDILYPDQSNDVKAVLGDVSTFFNTLP